MGIVHPRVAGIDMRKKLIWVAVPAAARGAGRADRDGAEVRYILAVAVPRGKTELLIELI